MELILGDGSYGETLTNISRLHGVAFTGSLKTAKCIQANLLESQKQIVPLIISWGFENDKFTDTEFQNQHLWQGTQDVSNYLTIPETIKFRDDNVWDDISRNCKQMIQEFYFFIHNKYNIQFIKS